MSKKKKYQFFGTLEDIVDLIRSLPPAPTQAFLQEWNEFISAKITKVLNHREFYHIKSKLRARFDKAREGATGFEGKDHWHIYNPFTRNKIDTYLDKDGNPVKDGSDASHIIPRKDGD